MRSVSIIDPDGMVNAWTISVRMTSARRTAMAIASTYSRRTDLRRRGMSMGIAPGWPVVTAGSVAGAVGAVYHGAHRVDRVAVEEHVARHQLRGPEVGELVVERGVALGDRLQLVVEVDDDLGQREVEADVHALAEVLERSVLAALLLGQL